MAKSYGKNRRLELSFAKAVEQVTAALSEQGFGVLTEIDVQATLKKKIDADFRRYVILGACNPHLANQALNSELEIGLLLPCNVVVYEQGEGSVVSIIDPAIMVELTGSAEMAAVAKEASARLDKVLEAL